MVMKKNTTLSIVELYEEMYANGAEPSTHLFPERIEAAARATISEKKYDEIKYIMREYIKLRPATNIILNYSKFHFLYVAANYFYNYLTYFYGIKDKFSDFITNGAQHLHYYGEPWLYHRPEEQKILRAHLL